MTPEYKRAWSLCIVRSLALSALCIIIASGAGCMANYLVPPVGL